MGRTGRPGCLTGKQAAGGGSAAAAGLATATTATKGSLVVVQIGEIRHPALSVFQHDPAVILHGRVRISSPGRMHRGVPGRATAFAAGRGHGVELVVLHGSGHLERLNGSQSRSILVYEYRVGSA